MVRLEQLEVELGDEVSWEIHAARNLYVMIDMLSGVLEAA